MTQQLFEPDGSLTHELICSECGEVRVRVPSGIMCPNGHGKVHPRASIQQLKTAARHKWAASLPTATRRKPGVYEIAGHTGHYQIVNYLAVHVSGKSSIHVPTGARCSDGVLAVLYGKRILIRKFNHH